MAQTIPSSYTWGQLFDLARRQGAASVNLSAADQLSITQEISAFCYRYELWSFTMAQTPLGSIQCVNLQQDYPQPSDLYRLSRAWFYVPTQNIASGDPTYDGTVPPVDDPSYAAYQAAVLSGAYVNAQGTYGGGTPAATIWPADSGSFDVVKRLPVSLYPYAYTQIRQICQQPNQNLLRLSSATAVPSNQPFSLECEYQPVKPPVNAMTEPCWFPDDYVSMAINGILYRLYLYGNDPRAGTASFSANGDVTYSGQYAVWMASLESAAAAERSGAVNTISPDIPLGNSGYYGYGGRIW